jgi:HAD superfamily hydrolase (TIGR01509 family)
MVKALLVDMMGVLVYDPYLEALQAATGLDTVTAHDLKDPDCWPLFEIGAIDESEFARRFFGDDAEASFDLEAFHRARRGGYRPLPGVRGLLEELEGRVERYVASNYPIWVEELAEQFGFAEYFEGVYASHHLQVRKPDPRFFDRLLERVGHEPGDCLFVDDRRSNCEAAEALGIRSHHFTGVEGLRRRLQAENLLPDDDSG